MIFPGEMKDVWEPAAGSYGLHHIYLDQAFLKRVEELLSERGVEIGINTPSGSVVVTGKLKRHLISSAVLCYIIAAREHTIAAQPKQKG